MDTLAMFILSVTVQHGATSHNQLNSYRFCAQRRYSESNVPWRLRSTPSQATTSMPTASSLSLNDSPSQTLRLSPDSEFEDRETFSHQTLILTGTALTAINNSNHHPTFMATEADNERIQYMKDTSNNTRHRCSHHDSCNRYGNSGNYDPRGPKCGYS